MKIRYAVFVLLAAWGISGCSFIDKARRADNLEQENSNLRYTLEQLKKEKALNDEIEAGLKKMIQDFNSTFATSST